MDVLSLLSVFSGLAGGIGSLLGLSNANSAAAANQASETQLLNEAQQQVTQEEAAPGLIAQRNSQEEILQGPLDKWTGTDTILGDVAKQTAAQPAETKTTQPAMQLGV